MSGIGDQDLVRVRDHSELRAGMTVVLKPCKQHGRACSVVLLRVLVYPHDRHRTDNLPCDLNVAWVTTDDEEPACFGNAIPGGRLYRLRDLDAADEQETMAVAALAE